MIESVTAGGVYWNEGHRLTILFTILKKYFSHISVVIQESTDDSLKLSKKMLDRPGDVVRTDQHRGAGDPSFPLLLSSVETPWVFIVSGDEIPTLPLLDSIDSAVDEADRLKLDGWWIPFRSKIEGIDFTSEQDAHLRLFRTDVGWPHAMLHSRPMTENTGRWSTGWIQHDRSLDEMVRDYVRYMAIGPYSNQWVAHNRMMIHDACSKVADHTGWDRIVSAEWWPEVRAVAFGGQDPQ